MALFRCGGGSGTLSPAHVTSFTTTGKEITADVWTATESGTFLVLSTVMILSSGERKMQISVNGAMYNSDVILDYHKADNYSVYGNASRQYAIIKLSKGEALNMTIKNLLWSSAESINVDICKLE